MGQGSARFKRLIKSTLRHVGYDLVQYVETPERPFQVLPYLVAERLQRDAEFFFVQIGAHDGVSNNPLRELVLRYGLAGLFVEPLPEQFERLRANYATQPNVAFKRCAIGREDGEADMYRVRADAPLPERILAVASFNREHLTGNNIGVPGVEKYVERIAVPSITLPSLIQKSGIQNLTLLDVDAEDQGCEIVRMALAANLHPPLINYASRHPAPSDRADCKKWLVEAGYCFVDIGEDTLAVRR